MKKISTVVIALLLLGAGYWFLDQRYVVPIVMYHNIAECDDVCPANTVSPDAFAKQMSFLQRHGYDVISVEEYITSKKSGQPFPHNTIVITFDDGYKDNYTHALPVLEKYDFPAAIFVAPADIEKERFLTWDQARAMEASVFTIGSHTMTQAYLPDVADPDQLRWEIRESKRVLEERLGRPIAYFAYPIGGFSEAIKEEVKAAGYQAAFATNRGYDRFNHDVYEINRIRVKDDDHAIELWVKFSGYYNLIRKSKSPY